MGLADKLVRVAATSVALFAVGAVMLLPSSGEGSVADQRQRLPPAAHCSDEVEGLWRAHKFNDEWNDWTIFTLEITRVRREGGEKDERLLTGHIFNDTWRGGPDDSEPGTCGGSVPWRVRVSMPAVGTFEAGRVSFRGTSWKMDEMVCGTLPFTWGYNLDHFTGTIDPAIQEFQSVNNDGGKAVNDPMVFRRVKCLDPAERKAKPVKIERPPLLPPKRSGGCG